MSYELNINKKNMTNYYLISQIERSSKQNFYENHVIMNQTCNYNQINRIYF